MLDCDRECDRAADPAAVAADDDPVVLTLPAAGGAANERDITSAVSAYTNQLVQDVQRFENAGQTTVAARWSEVGW